MAKGGRPKAEWEVRANGARLVSLFGRSAGGMTASSGNALVDVTCICSGPLGRPLLPLIGRRFPFTERAFPDTGRRFPFTE